MNALEYHNALKGKIEVISRVSLRTREDLQLAYTPGVAEPCLEIARDPSLVYDYTRKGNMVAVITDGSAVLGLGNIGAAASLPVMEGKCLLFKEFAGVDAFPIALTTQDTDEIVETILRIAPMFGGINLEDIAAPRCFDIEQQLAQQLDIPVFHDDQHGTAIVALAALYNALRVVGKSLETVRIVVNGVGAAGVAISTLLFAAGAKNLLFVDSEGLLCDARDTLSHEKQWLLSQSSIQQICGTLSEAVVDADVFIGVSKPGVLTSDMIRTMNHNPIVFAMANPTPEILPDEAKSAGAAVVATGRSDFPNQVNNVLAFPGIFRGLLDARITTITEAMKLAVARALADYVATVDADHIIPDALDKGVVAVVADAVKRAAV